MTAIHLGLPLEIVIIENLMAPDSRKLLQAKNPNIKIPVLEHGDFVLWESHAIMQYLADQVPGQSVYPSELRARADVNRWLFWSSQHWMPAVGVLVWEKWMKGLFGMGDPTASEVARGERDFATAAGVLDGHLGGREWLSGTQPTLADLSISTGLMRNAEAKISLDAYPQLRAWFDRVSALDAWKKTIPPSRG